MFAGFVVIPAATDCALSQQLQPPAYRAPASSSPPLPLPEVGTGGVATVRFIREALGYRPYVLIENAAEQQPVAAPFAIAMQLVKTGFGRTFSRLPEVFGVSRQTLYNWLGGETPRPLHQERLLQMAEAAQVFSDLGFKPTAALLERSLSQGKSFLKLMAEGGDGRQTAEKLVRVAERGNASRTRLDALLAGRKTRLSGTDIGAPLFDEDA